MMQISRKVPAAITKYLKEVLTLLQYEYTVEESSDESSFTSSLPDEEWENCVNDAYAFQEKDLIESPFKVVTLYTADSPERLLKFGIEEGQAFTIYSKDLDELPF